MPFFVLRLVLTLGTIAGAIVGVNKFTKYSEKNYFNKGVCKKCGGHFKLIEGTIGSPAKGYKCDVCDNCVWISYGSDEGYEYEPSAGLKNNKRAASVDVCPKCLGGHVNDSEITPPVHNCLDCGHTWKT